MNNIDDINNLKTPRAWKAELYAHVEQLERDGRNAEARPRLPRRIRPVRVALITAIVLIALSATASSGSPVCASPLIVVFARIMYSAAGTPFPLTSAIMNMNLSEVMK